MSSDDGFEVPSPDGAASSSAEVIIGDPSSALHDSILKKGSQSYYYAHGRRENLYEGVGREELIGAPKFIGRVSTPRSTAASTRPRKALDSYAWSDGTRIVSVIITMDGLAALEESNVILDFDAECDAKAVTLRLIDLEGVDYVLELKGLYEAVASVRTKRSASGALKIIMRKAKEFSWHKLKA